MGRVFGTEAFKGDHAVALTSKSKAQLNQGVLKLKLPKSEQAKPHKIPIQG